MIFTFRLISSTESVFAIGKLRPPRVKGDLFGKILSRSRESHGFSINLEVSVSPFRKPASFPSWTAFSTSS